MACKICGGPTKKPTAMFCSRECKIVSQRGKREPLDPTKRVRCKIDGKEYEDYLNRSGCLTVYSKATLGKAFDWNDWEVFDVDAPTLWQCPHCDWNTRDHTNKSGCITIHLDTVHGLKPEDHCKDYPADEGLWIEYWKHYRKEVFKEESVDNRVQCLECGEYFMRINNKHLINVHNMTLAEYDAKHGKSRRWSKTTLEKARSVYYSETGLSQTNYDSAGQVEIKEFIESLGYETKKHRTSLYEVDIFIESENIGFEYNGLFHHSEFRAGRGSMYHLDKTVSAERDGIRLYQIFEDEWKSSPEIVKSKICNILNKTRNKIYARLCVVKMLDKSEVQPFLDSNHLQGYAYADIHLGLENNGNIVQVMSISRKRGLLGGDTKDTECEIIRLCSKNYHTVVGGASKLLKYFERNFSPSAIITFADRRWTSTLDTSVYTRLGFDFAGETRPCFWGTKTYVKRDHHRSYFTKPTMVEKYPDVFSTVDVNAITQAKMMDMIGFDRVWDCGNLKYVKNLANTVLANDDGDDVVDETVYSISRGRLGTLEPKDDSDVKCALCDYYYPNKGMSAHLRMTHHIMPSEYKAKYGDYNTKTIKTLAKLIQVGDKFRCKICGIDHESDRSLTYHVTATHNLTKEQYVFDHILGGTPPTCKCGCGNSVGVLTYYPYRRDYVSGHNESNRGKRKSTIEREKLSQEALERQLAVLSDLTFGQQLAEYGIDPQSVYEYNRAIVTKDRMVTQNAESRQMIAHLVLKLIRTAGISFPYPPVFGELDEICQSIRNGIRQPSGKIFSNNGSTAGVKYLKSIFRSFWNSSFKGKKTPVEVWGDDVVMRKIIEYRCGVNDGNEMFDITLKQIVNGISVNRYTVSFFKPSLAASIYRHFIGDVDTPVVFDPCAGFGGRLLGFKAAYPNGRYIACEPNKQTYDELCVLAEDFDGVELYNCKLEDFEVNKIKDIDLAFTSIPYYDVETYSEVMEYADMDDWDSKFLSKIRQIPNLVLNVPAALRDRFECSNEYYIEVNTSNFDQSSDKKLEYLLTFCK